MNVDDMRKKAGNFTFPTTEQEQTQTLEYLESLGIDPSGYYQELEMSSRYVNTHRDVSFSKARVQLHSHNFYELLCCQEGSGIEYLVGTDRYQIQKGDILIIAPGVSHRPIFSERMGAYRRDVVWVSQEFWEGLAAFPSCDGESLSNTKLMRTAGTRWTGLTELFRRGVLEGESRQFGWELAVIGNTITLLTMMGRAAREGGTKPLQAEKRELIDQVMAYIEAHLAEKITLEEIARHFYVSESTVSHLFRQKMGVSFYRCVTQRRLIAAKSRIWEGEPLETVSQAVGFTDYSAFYRAVKREYGVSPRQIMQLKGKAVQGTGV